ncbi:hypothetical protein IHZ08_002083 [Salmonella enterica]|nr:hypothetical protein [Salmonella enterica]EHA7655858.1 hypothetical protein [Salmonella enterica]
MNKITAVFPAPAGINRWILTTHALPLCVPRASGDKPGKTLTVVVSEMCSPRQRG